jgi:hypothetical protein
MPPVKKVKTADTKAKKFGRKELKEKLETELGSLKEKLGEKKFKHRVKKATKVLMHGINKTDDKIIREKTNPPSLAPESSTGPQQAKSAKAEKTAKTAKTPKTAKASKAAKAAPHK